MKWVSVGVLGGAAAALWTVTALAQSEADNRTQRPARLMSAPQPALQPGPQRPVMYAPSSALSARRLSAEQRDEWRFLKEAAAFNRFETESSRLAMAKAQSPAVKAFAESMVDQHAATSNMLQHMLHVRSITAPMLDNGQRKTLNRLSKLQGRKFDREYVEQVVMSQQQSVAIYERGSITVREPALKGWIDHTLPTLQSQLASAEQIALPAEPKPRKATPRTQAQTQAQAQPNRAPVTARNTR